MSHKIAHLSLDFSAGQSVCGPERRHPMTPEILKPAIDDMLKGMDARLADASAIAKAANACAASGNQEQAITIALEIEQLVYEVNTLLNAASLINRCGKS